ncbi:MAG: ATP-dependent Clp protease ATP-binding subunit ClpX [Firmicutes bacterium]|nr:ATP-dependent Clp protease ATP-binding subunit ClpX [Bacillota bacterium]
MSITEGALPTPQELRDHLDSIVVGQEDAKKVLSVAVYNHYKRIRFKDSNAESGIEIKKSNIMMIGPTGSGKTYTLQALSKMLGVPLAMGDATVIVTSNDMGKAIEGLMKLLLDAAGGDVQKAEAGIVFIDEVDKLVTGINKVKGESIQQALLKVIEGTIMQITMDDGSKVELNTFNILFIAGGAFVNLAPMVQIRLGDVSAGLLTEEELVKQSTTEDLSKFGLIPEFVGRLPVIVVLTALKKDALIEALVRPKNSIVKQYTHMFQLDGLELVFLEETLEAVAEKAIEMQTGARGLRTVLENAMRDIMYQIPNEKDLKRVIMTPQSITGEAKPIFEYQQSIKQGELNPLPPKATRSTYAHAD